MMKKITFIIFILSLTFLFGCGKKLPLIVAGDMPTKKPDFHKFYDGMNLPKSKTSMVVGADAGDQASLYIVKVDGIRKKDRRLIGGPKAAIVLPGKHDITIQISDKGRLIIPLVLRDIELEAGVGYLINFRMNYPEKFEYLEGNDKLLITVSLVNLDTGKTVKVIKFNGWGKEVM